MQCMQDPRSAAWLNNRVWERSLTVHLIACRHAADELDQRHRWHRVHEVHADLNDTAHCLSISVLQSPRP